MEKEIKVGSVVCFKSAPNEKLTVVERHSEREVKVIFFNLRTNMFDSYYVDKNSLTLLEE